MDRNREARRAVAMANGTLHRRRHLHQHQHQHQQHRTSSTIPEEDGGGLRDRTVKDRDREMRDRDRDRDRISRSIKRRKSDESSDDSVNDDEDYDDGGTVAVTMSNQVHVSSSSPPAAAVTLSSQRKSYPPLSKVYKVSPTWKAPDEMIGVSIPRRARSASAKRSQEYWNSGGLLESSSSPMRSDTQAGATTTGRIPSPSSAPMSPSSSNVSMKKKIKQPNGAKHRPPKPTSKTSPSSIQDEIEIEVAEVLYGLMRQTQTPASSSKQEPVSHDSPTPPPLTFVAPKRKRPRLYPEEPPAGLQLNSTNPKPESNQPLKLESPSPTTENVVPPSSELPPPVTNNAIVSTPKLEEASSSSSPPKTESEHIQHHDRLQFPSTSTKPNLTPTVEKENRRGDKIEIDLMAPASPEKEEETGEYSGREVRDEKSMVTDREPDIKSKVNEAGDCGLAIGIGFRTGGGSVEVNRVNEAGDDSKAALSITSDPQPKMTLTLSPQPLHQQQIPIVKERNFDLQFDLEKSNDNKVNYQQLKAQLPEPSSRDDSSFDKTGVLPLPMSVPAGWHGGIAPPMGYVGPLQGVVSMDGTTMASPPIQPTPPHFLLSQPRPKRCATHCHIARSISVHQQMVKMSPFWPPVAAAPLFGAKPSNMNLVPSAELHSGRGGVVSLPQDIKAQPLAFFPGQPSPVATKDKNCQATSVSESAHKKQVLLQPGLPPGAATNMMHAPALFFPMGQQQATASTRPGSGKSPSTAGGAASTSTLTSAPMGAAVSNAPAMSFSYPNMNGNEAQFMAILGNGSYPFPIPAHVGAPPPYRGSHPQAMPFFNGSFYPSQMLHPSQLQPNHQNPTMSTAPSSSSHKHVQNQQRPLGNSPNLGNLNQNSSMQTTKSRDMGGEDSPSTTADSRNRPNMNVYGQNFVMPFHSPNFALMPSSLGAGNPGDKKHHQQQQSQQPAALNSPFPMSFATINGATTPGLDISSMSMPDAAKYSYQMMAAAAAAQAAQQGKTEHRGPENGKPVAADPSSFDEDRRGMASRASVSSVGQSIAFSRDTAENTVVDSSARSLKQQQQQQQQQQQHQHQQLHQQQSQLLFSKQQLYTPPTSSNAHSKTPSTSNRNVYPDNLTSSTIMGAKFPSNLSGFPIGGSTQSQWKNSVRPNTPQISSPSITTTSSPSNVKNLSQPQGRSQSQTHISFGASQGQQTHSSSHAPVGSPSNSLVSKTNGGSPRTSASNKSLGQQGKKSPSQTQSTQKPYILGSPHMVPSQGSAEKSQSQQPHQQPQLSKQSIQQAQLYFNNYMQANTSAAMVGTGYYLQQQQQLQQHMQQQQLQQHMQQQLQGSKSKGSAPPISSTTCSPVTASDPTKAVGTAGQSNTAASNSKGGLHSLGMYNTAQSSGGAHQLTPASFPYMNVASSAVPVKPDDQKQPAGIFGISRGTWKGLFSPADQQFYCARVAWDLDGDLQKRCMALNDDHLYAGLAL
ncbi:hypothetical protein KSS87_023004 [Heliosperma pusillum]|nr:hypothetical protein KSS87_023004 [Heliosperma pusillum]